MRTHRSLLAIAATLSLVAPPLAGAQGAAPPPWPGLSLTFLHPTGTGTPTTSFEVWVRATLAPTADAFVLDGTSPSTGFGLPAWLLPAEGSTWSGEIRPFAAYDDAALATGYLCNNDTFFFGCSAGPYAFSFNFNGSGQPAWQGQQTFTLLPGQSYDYLFGTLTPPSGGAPPGTYRFTGTFANVAIYGRDANDEPLYQFVTLAESCDPADPSTPPGCGFSRTIGPSVAVPEPATIALVATGLLALLGTARRVRRG